MRLQKNFFCGATNGGEEKKKQSFNHIKKQSFHKNLLLVITKTVTLDHDNFMKEKFHDLRNEVGGQCGWG